MATLAPIEPADFDHASAAQMSEPYAMYEEFRQRCPVAHSNSYGGFTFVTRYDDVKHVFQDFKQFSSTSGGGIPPQPLLMYPIDLDPPRSTLFRRILNPMFTPEAVARHTNTIQQVIDDLIDAFIEDGSADLASQLVRPSLPRVVLPLIGVPLTHAHHVVEHIDVLTRRHQFTAEQIGEAFNGLAVFLHGLIASRRAGPPGEDVIAALLTATVEGRPLTDDDIFRTIMIILFGGLDTTTAVLLEALLQIGTSPTDRDALAAMSDLTPAIEEFVRYTSPVQGLRRTARANAVVGGEPIAEGAPVFALLGSANHDPAVFADPERCMWNRESNPHIGFGAGAHICLGRNLARLEIAHMLRTVMTRLPDLMIDPGFKAEYAVGETRGIKALPAHFTPGHRLVS